MNSNNRIRPRPTSRTTSNSSTSTGVPVPQSLQHQRRSVSSGNRPTSLHNNSSNNNNHANNSRSDAHADSGSSLVPIWALAAANVNLVDHSTKATATSSFRKAAKGMGMGTNNYTQQSMSYLQRNPTSTPLSPDMKNKQSQSMSQLQSQSQSQSQIYNNADAISEYSGTKKWIRSGNKWIITSQTREGKIHPTAVSSYGTNSPTRYDASASASAISSFAGSSTSGLYTRMRMATTPGGFRYMPALHTHLNVQKKGEAVPSSEGGISAMTGITSNSNGGHGGSGGGSSHVMEGRFQNSYLLDAKPILPMIHHVKEKEMATAMAMQLQMAKQMEKEMHNRKKSGGLSSSGYDSEGICEERLKEWKENFVEKFIDEGDFGLGGNHTQGRIRSKSLDSDCDSEANSNMVRLTEWKEEQYRQSSSQVQQAQEQSQSHSHSRSNFNGQSQSQSHSRFNSVLQSPIIPPTASKIMDSHEPMHHPLADDSINAKDSFENGYDSSNYKVRLKEWKEKQYSYYGSGTGNGNGTSTNTAASGAGGGGKSLSFRPMPESAEFHSFDYEYDSDSTRRERLKEWKEQFGNVNREQEMRLPPKPHHRMEDVQRCSSLTAETGGFGDFDIMNTVQSLSLDRPQSPLETINSTATTKSRRGKAVPGGGIFPMTSPQRKQNEVGFSQSSIHKTLPPLTPPRTENYSGNILTPKMANSANAGKKRQQESDMETLQAQPEESHVVAKAAKFLLSLSPLSNSEDGPASIARDYLIGGNDYNNESHPMSPPNAKKGVGASAALNLWNKPGRSDSIQSDDSFIPIGDASFESSVNMRLPSWDNCLYVRAEGARSGRICLSSTHLFFIYEESDSLMARYGWNRDQLDDFLLELEGPSSRGATPVNVPLDESGQGEAVELIGSDGRLVNFMALLENGFENSSLRSSFERQKENPVDRKKGSERVDSKYSSLRGLNLSPSNALNNTSIEVRKHVAIKKMNIKRDAASPVTGEGQRQLYMDELPPISLSSSSLDSFVDYEEMLKVEEANQAKDNSFSRDLNEDVMNNSIIRAIKEEAHMRLQEDERTASFSAIDKTETSNAMSDQDDTTLYGNQTNVSSFSEPDLDMDPNQERILYISGKANVKRRYIGIKWPLTELAEIFDRRYMMKEVGLELYAPSSSQLTTASASSVGAANSTDEIDVPLGPLSQSSIFLVIPGFDAKSPRFRRRRMSRRDTFVDTLKRYATHINDAHWQGSPRLQRKWKWRKSDKTDPLSAITRAWRKGHISNFDYLLRLNAISGRSFHDPGNYPIMPWVLSNFTSTSVPDLGDERNYRNLSKPMGALCPDRLRKFQEKYASLFHSTDTAIPPFMYGSHYSNTGGVVLHYLVRVRPFAGLHRQLQGGQFDLPDRLFRSVSQTWDICSKTSTTEVKELTPEWYSETSFLKNTHGFNLGTSAADGATVSDVVLPPWANGDPLKFIEVMRNALESDYCSAHLPDWIDLVFGW